MTTIPARLWKLFHKMHPEPEKPQQVEKLPDRRIADYGAWLRLHDRFTAMLACKAYESAALMLVPEGWDWTVYSRGEASVHQSTRGCRTFFDETAPTAAEALIAALEAMENDDAQ